MKLQSSESQNVWEFKRIRAIELYEGGMKQVDIAKVLGVSKGAVSQWISLYRKYGLDALRYRKIARKHCRLSEEQLKMLGDFLRLGAQHFGYSGEIWTLPRVGELIFKKFGIRYSKSQVGVILKKIGWTYQKPVVRAAQRDDEAAKKWQEEKWPEIKKRPSVKEGR